MAKHPHKHSNKHKQSHPTKGRSPHKDWRLWVVIGLMLAAMLAYVLSDDEALQPGGSGDQPSVPAAEE